MTETRRRHCAWASCSRLFDWEGSTAYCPACHAADRGEFHARAAAIAARSAIEPDFDPITDPEEGVDAPTVTVTLIEETPTKGRGFATRRRFRIVGEPTSEPWKKSRRPAREPWCELTIYSDSDSVTSYGGELWPTAWPEWFTSIPNSVQGGSGGIHVTEAGMKVLRAAANAEVGAPPQKIKPEEPGELTEVGSKALVEIEGLAITVRAAVMAAAQDGDVEMIEAIRKDVATWKEIIDEA